MTCEVIETEFGKASLNNNGYYRVTSGKFEGKLLHRLIFEDFYNIDLDEEFPEGVVIHHLNEDKTCNEIWNLIPMIRSEHSGLHHTGMNHTEETKEKIRQARLGSHHSEETKKLFSQQRKGEKNVMYGRKHTEHSKRLMSEHSKGIRPQFESKIKHSKTTTSTGFYGVYKLYGKYRNGFTFRYQHHTKEKRESFSSVDLLKLKNKVLKLKMPWKIVDEEKAKATLESVGLTIEEIL